MTAQELKNSILQLAIQGKLVKQNPNDEPASVLLEKIKDYQKDAIYNMYVRIVKSFKEYEQISRKKMIEEVYKIYEDYNNIIDICTLRELKYLKQVVEENKKDIERNKLDFFKYEDFEHNFEIINLRNKFLIWEDYDKGCYIIPDEISDKVEMAINNYDINEVKRKDSINEIAIGILTIYKDLPPQVLMTMTLTFTGINGEELATHFNNNRVFNYYIFMTDRAFMNRKDICCCYFEYYKHLDEFRERRKIYGRSINKKINLNEMKTLYKNMFYYELNIENSDVKKLYNIIKRERLFRLIKEELCYLFTMHYEYKEVLNYVQNSFIFRDIINNKEFINTLEKAYYSIPSGVLSGLTPLEYEKTIHEEIKYEKKRIQKYIKQTNACLSKSDAKLFYKIYFALLEFTNNKYHVNGIKKIYKKLGVDPSKLTGIIDKLWKKKDIVFPEFIKNNPYKFNKEELDIVKNMQKGKRGLIIINEYTEDYTKALSEDCLYMIKGINCNIDEIITYNSLPVNVITTILPFKDYLIYDGIFNKYDIQIGVDMKKNIDKESSKKEEIYHM